MSPLTHAVAGLAAVVLAALVAGCSSSHSPAATGSASAGPVTAPCAAQSCTPGKSLSLGGGYTARLWSSAAPTTASPADLTTTPVVELLSDGVHRQWWVGRVGYGWAASLSCLPTSASPNCVVAAEVGSHAGVAEAILLQHGQLVSPATASVTFDSGTPVASDLDGDGLLDVMGIENDYTPSYATGHNFWASYRLAAGGLHQTGCTPVHSLTEKAPTTLLTGTCPVVQQN